MTSELMIEWGWLFSGKGAAPRLSEQHLALVDWTSLVQMYMIISIIHNNNRLDNTYVRNNKHYVNQLSENCYLNSGEMNIYERFI